MKDSGLVMYKPNASGVEMNGAYKKNLTSRLPLTLFVLIGVLLNILTVGAFAAAEPIKVMPLGDSNTVGCCGTNPGVADSGGYRKSIYDELVNNGYGVNFVGEFTNPRNPVDPDFDRDHQGQNGAAVNTMRRWIKEDAILERHQPDVILYHIGTNDLADPRTDPEDVAAEVKETLDEIYRQLPSVTVLLARIILTNPEGGRFCADQTASDAQTGRTKRYNESLRALAQEFFNRGHLIAVVDMETALDYNVDMDDCFHPKLSGYEKMADKWFEAFRQNVAVRPSPPGEIKLLGKDGILDQLYQLENLMLPTTGDVDQIWLNHSQGTVTAKATFTEVKIPDSEQKGRILGYRDAYDEFHEIFELNTANSEKEKIDEKPGVGFGVLPIQERLPAFPWGIDPDFSSRPSDNEGPSEKEDGADRMMAWLIINGESKGNYVMAWEDFDDFDYNDLVIEVNNVAPLKQTPVFSSPGEPDLLGLAQAKDDGSGSLMDGILDELYGLENLTRIPDDDDQFWVNLGNGSAMAKAAFTDVTPENFRSLGVIGANDEPRDFLFVLSGGLGDLGTGNIPSKDIVPVFRWHLGAPYTSLNSQPSGNHDGQDRMVTYQITGRERRDKEGVVVGENTVGNFVLAWDDGNRGDSDYQDLVVEVSNVIPAPQVNDRIVPLSEDDVITEYIPPIPGEPGPEGGIFTIKAKFTNESAEDIISPFFGVVASSGGNQLLNADRSPGGVGATLTPDAGGDGVLESGESKDVVFKLGLQEAKPFTFFVDLFEGVSP